jgi:hypothetical protein
MSSRPDRDERAETPEAPAPQGPAERITRPALDRSHPIRGWSTLFAAPVREGEGGPAATPAGGGSPGAGAAAGASPGAAGDVAGAMAQAIDIAFRAASEYTQQTQRTAQRLGAGGYGLEAVAGDVQHLTARFGQYASEMAQVWFQLMQAAMTGQAPAGTGSLDPTAPFAWLGATARPSAASQSNGAAAAPSGATEPVPSARTISLALLGPRRIDVSLDLREEACGKPLVVQALRPIAPGAAPILGGKLLVASDGAVRLELAVPPEQPPGEYGAAVIDAVTNVRAGTVRVVVGPLP